MKLWKEGGQQLERGKITVGGRGSHPIVCPVIDLIGHVLKHLGEMALDKIKDRLGLARIAPGEISWVLTVPAIWSDIAKVRMRRAALKAGLIQSLDAPNLNLVYEPEAAALCCAMETKFAAGLRFLVVDCGGGTVDITAHEVQPDGTYRSLIKPCGDCWGSTFVDKAFYGFLCEVFEIKLGLPNNVSGPLMNDLAKIREQITHRTGPLPTYSVPVGGLIRHLLGPFPDKQKVSRLEGQVAQFGKKKGIELLLDTTYGDNLEIPEETVKSFFKPVCDKIAPAVLAAWESLRRTPPNPLFRTQAVPPPQIYLVGGFSNSPFLVQHLRQYLAVHAQVGPERVIYPRYPTLAVCKGAVYSGLQPNPPITSHCTNYSYGMATTLSTSSPDEHRGRNCLPDSKGVLYLDNVYMELVPRGCECKKDDPPRERDIVPFEDDAQFIECQLYSYDPPAAHVNDPVPTFVDGPGFHKLAVVRVDTPGPQPAAQRGVRVRFVFDGTFLRFEAVYSLTGRPTQHRILWEDDDDDGAPLL